MPVYHVWFSTKRRKWLLQDDIADACKQLMMEIAREKGIRFLACEPAIDHMHLLIDIENRERLSKAMNLLKGISARRIFERFLDLKMDEGISHFWQHRYATKEVEPGAVSAVSTYIETQNERLEKFER